MKKILLFLTCLIMTGKVCAWEYTTDRFVISDLTVAPGGDAAFFYVSLEGSRLYTAFNMDIHLPEGLDVDYYKGAPDVSMYKGDGMYPYEEDRDENKTYLHGVGASYNNHVIRIACSGNVSNPDFLKQSGKLLKIYVKASPFMKPGSATITIDGQNLTMANGTKYVPYEYEKDIDVSTTSKVAVNVNAENKWSTCVLPFASSVPNGVTVYSCASTDGDNLVLKAEDQIQAYTPYILYAPTGYSATLSGEVDPAQYSAVVTNGLLSGAVVAQTVTEGYVLQNQGEGAMFYDIDGQTFVIPEGRCWLAESSSLSKTCYGFTEQTNGISNATMENTNTIYNLHGMKVEQPHLSGVYIVNGKKTIK